MQRVHPEGLVEFKGPTKQGWRLGIGGIPSRRRHDVFHCPQLELPVRPRRINHGFRLKWIDSCVQQGSIDQVETHAAYSRVVEAEVQPGDKIVSGCLGGAGVMEAGGSLAHAS
jgi:hypothetical protein